MTSGREVLSRPAVLTPVGRRFVALSLNSPRRPQLDSGFVDRGTLQFKRLQRAAVIELFPWGAPFPGKSVPKPVKERPDGIKLARHYQALLASGKFENRAALARYLGVSRARVTQVLKRLHSAPAV